MSDLQRFYYQNFGGHKEIIDDLTGKRYVNYISSDLCDLLNQISNRSDRNAELLDMDKLTMEHQIIKLKKERDFYKYGCNKIDKLLTKYKLNNDLVELDQILSKYFDDALKTQCREEYK